MPKSAAPRTAIYERLPPRSPTRRPPRLPEPGFSEGNFKGSVADYFKAQSNGKFEMNFDVMALS